MLWSDDTLVVGARKAHENVQTAHANGPPFPLHHMTANSSERIEDIDSGLLEITNIAGDNSQAMSQCRRCDHAIEHW